MVRMRCMRGEGKVPPHQKKWKSISSGSMATATTGFNYNVLFAGTGGIRGALATISEMDP